MNEFIHSGRAVDVVLLVLAIEAVLLASRGWRWVNVALMLLPAAFILLALRAALVGSQWYWISGLLAASFPFHLVDLSRRRPY